MSRSALCSEDSDRRVAKLKFLLPPSALKPAATAMASTNVDLLILDEVGFVPFQRDGGELLFNVITQRYERRSLLVTTNLAFAEWPKVFGDDEKLTTALLDRLADRATVIATKGKSYRMRRRSAQIADTPAEPAAATKKR